VLNAILRSKKRGTGLEGVRLSEEFTGAEDTLTATVFERLFYMPDEIVGAILFHKRVWGEMVVAPPAQFEVRFWPTLNEENIDSAQPDLVIQFSDRVLVIEAKRNDFGPSQQSASQLKREYDQARTSFPASAVWLLAVGGVPDGQTAKRPTPSGNRCAILWALMFASPPCLGTSYSGSSVKLLKITR
jgi:hypothetical protein